MTTVADVQERSPNTSSPYVESAGIELSGDLVVLGQGIASQLELPTDRSSEVFRVSRDPDTYEVTVSSDKQLEDYKELSRLEDWDLLLEYAEQMRGRSIAFINPTMEGGGVAMLRPPLIHLLRQLGIDAHWFVMEGNEEVFKVTKKIHNIMQDRLDPEDRLTEEERATHWGWNQDNARVLAEQPAIANTDILFIDDPQPAPLINLLSPHLVNNPFIIWRDHIHTDHELMSDPSTAQGEVARYLLERCGVKKADAIIGHPRLEFRLPGMEDKTAFAPATTDPFDDLNRELAPNEVKEGIDFINDEISKKNRLLARDGRYEDIINEIDTSRPRIILVARFDESKGMDHALELGTMVRARMIEQGYSGDKLPQIILIGNGSVDDPSGEPMYEQMLRLRREKYPDEKADMVVMRLRHNYGAMNALMTTTEAPMVGIQMSEKEGCETRISDEIEHEVPVIAFNNGGMPLQIIEGKSGFVLDYNKPDHDLERGADIIARLLSDSAEYARLQESTKKAGETFNRVNFGTISNIARILRTLIRVQNGQNIDQLWKMDDLVAQAQRDI